MRYLLDINIISNVIKSVPSESLLTWMSDQRAEDLFIASLTLAEIRRGILEKPVDEIFAGINGIALCVRHIVNTVMVRLVLHGVQPDFSRVLGQGSLPQIGT